MAPRGGKRENVLEADISFDMKRLFDPYNFDHIPHEERLSLFKQRNLPHVKHYKAAVKIFGGPPVRRRAIVAPPMETPLKHRLGLYQNVQQLPAPPVLNGPLKPIGGPKKEQTAGEKEKLEEDEKLAEYKSWISKRKEMRGNLDNLGLNESLLARKPDKTELEKRVQAKFRADRLWKPETPPPQEVTPSPQPLPDVPTMTVPPPDGLQILDKFLSQNRMRLMDLFQIADKDKSWSLSREELMKAVCQSDIPLDEAEVDDMVLALDVDNDDELSFKEMNTGLMQWRKQRRQLKKQGAEISTTSASTAEQLSKKPSTSQSHSVRRTKTPLKDSKPVSRETTKDRMSESEAAHSVAKTGQQSQQLSSKEKVSRESSKKLGSLEPLSREHTMESDVSGFVTTPRRQHSKERISRESLKKSGSQEFLARDQTMSGKASSLAPGLMKEKSNVSKVSRTSSQGGKRLQIIDSDSGDMSVPLPPSQGNQSSWQGLEEGQTESNYDRSVYEDVLFQSDESPRAYTAQDLGERLETAKGSEKTERTKFTSEDAGTRPSSCKAGSAHSSRTGSSTPNTLEPPEFDLRQESRAPESAEALLDTRKHDRVVLSRNNIKRSLSREQRVVFDELPGVIKVGYRPIDDHCSESTMTGDVTVMMNQFRREKLKEYFEVKKICEESGLPLSQKTLDRVLLYPGDRPSNQIKKTLATPLGPLTNEMSPFNQPKPKKKTKKKRRGLGRMSRTSGVSGGRVSGAGGAITPRGNISATSGADGNASDDRQSSAGSKGYITVEDVYPFAATVAPKVYKENLSSGRALITRKVDNWMTFEEYNKYTANLPNRFSQFNRRSNPDSIWPGYVLDKLRLCLGPEDGGPQFTDGQGKPLVNRDSCAYEGLGVGMYNGNGHAVFRNVQGPAKRAYPGYNNDLLTWPVGENGVRYANIDQHRVVS